jgi:hypothetical protein
VQRTELDTPLGRGMCEGPEARELRGIGVVAFGELRERAFDANVR